MAWRAPANFVSMNFRGIDVVADTHGEVDLSAFSPDDAAALAADLISHGFVPVGETLDGSEIGMRADHAEGKIAEATAVLRAERDDLHAERETLYSRVADAESERDRALALLKAEGAPSDPVVVDDADKAPEDEPGFDPAAVSTDDIDAMNRNELFAFLKARGASAVPPIKNDELRTLAHEAAAK